MVRQNPPGARSRSVGDRLTDAAPPPDQQAGFDSWSESPNVGDGRCVERCHENLSSVAV